MEFADRIADIVDVLNKGGVILNPTDTIWGLGCHSQKEKAIDRIFSIKKREKDKPLLLLASSIEMIKDHVMDIHPRIETLLQHHKKPLTIIYPKAKNVHPLLTHSSGTVAIRLTHDPFCKTLVDALGAPLVSTSANVSNKPFPNNFADISSSVINKVDYVCKHKQEEMTENEPSILVSYDEEGELTFLRE